MGANFTLEVFDWNQIEQAKSLGSGTIDLESLEPFHGTEQDVPLTHPKYGAKGHIRVMLTFRPEIIAKSRKNTSTFSSAGRAMTQIGHLPVGAGKGVFNGVTGVFRRAGASDSDSDRMSMSEKDFAASAAPTGQASQPVGSANLMPASTTYPTLNGNGNGVANGAAASEPGTLKVTVVDAKDLSTSDTKPYVVVRVGDKEHKTKHIKSSTPEWYVALSVVYELTVDRHVM